MSSGVKCLSQMNTLPSSICFRELASTVDNSVSRYNVQWRLSPAFLVFFVVVVAVVVVVFFSWEGGILKIPIPSYFGFRDMPHPNIEQFAPASLNIFILCNGSQLLACTFNVTWRPEFPNNNIFARDWAVSRHSVAETMFCYSCCAARDSHRVTQRKQWF